MVLFCFVQIYDELSKLVLEGNLRSKIAAVYSFDQIHRAIEHVLEGPDGKVIIVPG